MSTFLTRLSCVAIVTGLMLASSSVLASGSKTYHVTITNLTNSITFTPILVASHRKGLAPLVELGSSASPGITEIAEGGATGPLMGTLALNPLVEEVTDSGGLLGPGESVTVVVSAKHGARRISIASMMLPTNDGFIGLNEVKTHKNKSVTYYSPGYDAGTEPNDELCVSIPGPTCGGAGLSSGVDGEGYVHINRGIHGVGSLAADIYDWRNPVAKITIIRIKDDD